MGPTSWLQADKGDVSQLHTSGLGNRNPPCSLPATIATSNPPTVLIQSLMKSSIAWAELGFGAGSFKGSVLA